MWLPHRSEYLMEYICHDGRRSASKLCSTCQTAEAVARCEECDFEDVWCLECVKARHAYNPLHMVQVCFHCLGMPHTANLVQVWKDGYYQQTPLESLGLTVQLGHRKNDICSKRIPRQLVVIHTNGIHKVNVYFCGCQPGLKHRQQLMRFTWWPATSTDPKTCATFRVLRLFRHENLQGNMTAYDFYKALENMTDPWHLSQLPVSHPL